MRRCMRSAGRCYRRQNCYDGTPPATSRPAPTAVVPRPCHPRPPAPTVILPAAAAGGLVHRAISAVCDGSRPGGGEGESWLTGRDGMERGLSGGGDAKRECAYGGAPCARAR